LGQKRCWRIAKRRYADLSGSVAKRVGGRWNRPGAAIVYTANHPALAALDVRVHLDLPPDLFPDDFVLMKIALTDEPAETLTEFSAHQPTASSVQPRRFLAGARNILGIAAAVKMNALGR
jgi:RES domain-containing protein